MLGKAAHSVWAKYDDDTKASMPLYQHMRDSAGITGKLWDEWLPKAVKRQIRIAAGDIDDQQARVLATWLACVHDAGKAHPLFATQVDLLTNAMHLNGLPFHGAVTPEQRIPHSVLSHAIVRNWLCDRYGFTTTTADSYAAVPGGHHGVPPGSQTLAKGRCAVEGLEEPWLHVQRELLDDAAAFTGADAYFDRWREHRVSVQGQLLLTAVVIAADWIASNVDYFPFQMRGTDQQRVEDAWVGIGLAPPWHAGPVPPSVVELFRDRFDLPAGASPNPMQDAAVAAAHTITEPGVMVIEAPMGEGKTEAALAVAEVFAEKWGLGGVMIGLPTQATSDGLFSRVVPWVDHQAMLAGRGTEYSMYLAHSKAGLNKELSAMPRAGSIMSVFDDDQASASAAVAHQWLLGRKKGVLADFVVGTVDQILFAALQSKHVVLRHLGLAGKVIIIDEVHAYDVYMNVYLKRALHWLAAYGVPVILLSATLPATTRRQLVEAYESGRVKRSAPMALMATPRRRTSKAGPSPLDGNPGYPLIVTSSSDGPSLRLPAPSGHGMDAELRLIDDGQAALLDALAPIREHGGCVGIICNTVGRAQEVFDTLSDVFSVDELILDHSRFLAPDRARIEANIRSLLGPDAAVRASGKHRPQRLLVVGTQVLEQSLDIDFDLLITDFAPTDLLLQRMGRLHRRRSPDVVREEHVKTPMCLVRGVTDWNLEPPAFDDGSTAVYGRAVLLRSAAVLRDRLDTEQPVRLPEDISTLVQATYADTVEKPDSWADEYGKAEGVRLKQLAAKEAKAKGFLLSGPSQFSEGLAIDVLTASQGNAESDASGEAKGLAQVRDIQEALEVVVVYRNDGLRFLPHLEELGNRRLPEDVAPDSWLARELSACTVRLPGQLCRWDRIDMVLKELERDGIAAWQASRWLKGQLVMVLDKDFSTVLAGVEVHYDPRRGLMCRDEKRDEANE